MNQCVLYSNCCDKLISCTTCSQFICENCFCKIVESLIKNKICIKNINDTPCPCCRSIYNERNIKKFLGKKKYINYENEYTIQKFLNTTDHQKFLDTLTVIPTLPDYSNKKIPEMHLIENDRDLINTTSVLIEDFNKVYNLIVNYNK
jgi:hypothetical protein